ncbi:DUF6351 family protein [Amphritea sp. HPY]|uniref:DUF6351 family protein n=1 Tax=Amphritea sp. HPY TaxID=3421652 RepID=UPI003D7EA288
MKYKYLGITVATLLTITAVLILTWNSLLNLLPGEKAYLFAKVQALPPRATQQLIPYYGPHPRNWLRTEDTFSYPIALGETGPVSPRKDIPLQYPFSCDGERSKLGQPIIDNSQGWGIKVSRTDTASSSADSPGYSKDCLHPTQAWYLYNRIGTEKFYPLEQANGDIAKVDINGVSSDFIIRVEMGTINRFLYVIAALKGPDGSLKQPDSQLWNDRLIYQFRGGVGIGYRQGRISPEAIPERRYQQLKLGYAIAYSTANQTSNHYDIWLAEDTALRVKNQFSALYGRPLYTIGIGGSGGAIQQYLIGQNGSSLLDGGLALYSYPDMLSQTLYAFDCELLEYYFDVMAESPRWRNRQQRQLVEGLNSNEYPADNRAYIYEAAMVAQGLLPRWPDSSSECVRSWRGLTPLVNNPQYAHFLPRYSKTVQKQTHWSHWDSLEYIYGTRPDGYAMRTWDNVGVQYGLNAVRKGQISIREFLHLNASIGGWKQPNEMIQEQFWRLNGQGSFWDFSPWSHHNMNLSPDGGKTPAVRTRADLPAIQAAYQAGHIFIGQLNIPVIDLRHYLEQELDMHHSSASFSTRLRLLQRQGHHDNQLIWISDKHFDPTPQALEAMTQWLDNQRLYDSTDPQLTRPDSINDRCYDQDGEIIANGATVWNGHWNQQSEGPCMAQYPIYSTSRTEAGESLRGDIFKCQLMPVAQAIESGLYEPIDMGPQQARLEQIFAEGVCDYSKPDQGLPEGLLLN